MDRETVLLKVMCPDCGTKAATDFPVLVVVTALTQWNNMRLYGNCKCEPWDASAKEIQGLRDQLGPAWMQAHAKDGLQVMPST